jgi:P pilus assembly chaperone PapD
VLLEWRRGTRGWQGRAVWVADDDDGPVLLQSWVDAAHLATAATETP